MITIKRRRLKGQSLVEFALLLIPIMFLILNVPDVCFFIANAQLANKYASEAAHEAAIYRADGSHTCQGMVNNVIGTGPPFMMLDPKKGWNMTVSPCPNDTGWTSPTGTFVTATITFHQEALFVFSSSLTVVAQDIFQ